MSNGEKEKEDINRGHSVPLRVSLSFSSGRDSIEPLHPPAVRIQSNLQSWAEQWYATVGSVCVTLPMEKSGYLLLEV